MFSQDAAQRKHETRLTRSRWARTGALALAGVTIAACSSSNHATSTGGKNTKPLLVGISLSLTGDFSDPGKAAQRGYQVWADSVNARGGVLGRKVVLKIVDDTSNPNQVITNYQNLISKDKVDITFGPFSSLLTVPAARVADRYHYAFLEPAGGGPKVFAEKLHNIFFVQPAPVVKGGDTFADYILGLPTDQRPKTAAYPELDDPFAQPVAESIRAKFEAAGIKTVFVTTYPAETTDMTPTVAKAVAKSPDVIVAGTQSEDAYGIVKALVQLKYNPKWLYLANGASSATEFPDKVGLNNVDGVFSTAVWTERLKNPGSADFVKAYAAKYGTSTGIDDTSAEAYACGQLLEAVAKKAGKVDNATLIDSLHQGSWPTLMGDISWDSIGQPQGSDLLVQWQSHKLLIVGPQSQAEGTPVAPKPAWGA